MHAHSKKRALAGTSVKWSSSFEVLAVGGLENLVCFLTGSKPKSGALIGSLHIEEC